MKTRALLNISQEQYDVIVFNLFFEWISHQTCSLEVLQLRLINKSLQNYFKHQLNIVESEFKRDIDESKVKDLETIQHYYTIVIASLKNYYPSALFKNVKQPQNKRYDKSTNYQAN